MAIGNKKINIEISTNSIIKILIVLFLLWILYLIQDVVAILFFVIILVSVLEPIVSWLRNKKIPKFLSVIIIYFVLLAVVALIFILLIPPIIDQMQHLSANFPRYWQKMTIEFSNVGHFLNQYGIDKSVESFFQSFKMQLPDSTSEIFTRVGNFFAGIVSLIIILVITFYILVEQNAIKKVLRQLVPSQSLPYAYQLVNRIQQKLGLWLRGQLILGFIIFLLVYFALLLSGVKYALILAIIAGLLEFIPYLGPFVSGFIAVFLTLFQSPLMAFWVLILYIVIQFFENHIFVPMIMKKTVGLNPVVSIIALLIGGKLAGLIGVILAIPVVTALSVFVQDFLDKKKSVEMRLEE